jgi:hypothetical protein
VESSGDESAATIVGTYGKSSFLVEIELADFDPSKHYVLMDGDQATIDGARPLGTEGGIPRREIVRLEVAFNGKHVPIPKSLYADCFELRLVENGHGDLCTSFWMDPKGEWGRVDLTMEGSDAGGAYKVTWILTSDGKHRRFIDIP